MPVSLVLIRHGQTDSNAGGVLQGHLPTALNDLGRRQAALVAARLCRDETPFDVLISSDLARATETAAPIAAALRLPLRLDPAWRERGFGELEGQTIGDVAIWRAASGADDPPGGEPMATFERRVCDALLSVAATAGDCGSVAIVTHGGPIRVVLMLLADGRLPITPGTEAPRAVAIANASLLRLSAERDPRGSFVWRVHAVNDVSHLHGLVTIMDPG